jgi:hypothetical protein
MDASQIDPILGAMTFNPDLSWWEGTFTTIEGNTVPLYVSVADDSDAEQVLPTAGQLLQNLAPKIDEAKVCACNDLLPLKNESWLEDEQELSPADFISRLSLESITLSPEGECEIFFADGELFWGHVIIVLWNHTKGFHSAEIAG